ncbi:MAG: hypothetical protein ACR2IF_06635 [Terriglobales bacterium]
MKIAEALHYCDLMGHEQPPLRDIHAPETKGYHDEVARLLNLQLGH